ncbi:hypothetical protein ACFC1I_13600 [Microbacterium sp. NPDC056044]|uniref:hypothetical protein n=1 Tax=Microbacterium sp. NPDC056044 TaxID=3345690 RepID=UPI0035E11CCB
MTEKPSPDPDAAQPAVEVDVARTGGFAGITRRWSAQPPEAEASDWITLIDRCPWSEAGTGPGDDVADDDRPAAPPRPATRRSNPLPDGFVWFIRATWSGADAREAELPDDEVVGAWRELVDAVRDWSRQSAGTDRPNR